MDNPDLEIINKPDFDSSNGNGVGYGGGNGYGDGDSNGNSGFGVGNGFGFGDGDSSGIGDGNGNGFAHGEGDGNGNHYGTGSGNGDGDGFVHGYSDGYDYGYGGGNGDGCGDGDGSGDSDFRQRTGQCSYETSRVFVSHDTPIIAWWRMGEREHFGKPLPVEPGSVHEWPYEPVLCEHGLHACWRKDDTSNYSDRPLYKVACSGWVRTDGEKLVCTRRVVLGKIINPLE